MAVPNMSSPGLWRSIRSREAWLLAFAVVLLAGWARLATSEGPAPFGSKTADGYYNLLTEGFLSGQLSLRVDPAPGLLRLPNPYDPVANAPFRIHDASLFHGRYYLYYGVGPAVVLFMPWRLLTGTYLSEFWAVAGFCLIGVAASGSILLSLRRNWFGSVSTFVILLMLVAQTFGTMVPSILPNAYFYQVPISAAYAFMMVGLRCIVAALSGPPASMGRRLALASFFIGLAVASRANYVLLALVVFLPPTVWWIWWRPGAQGFRSWETPRVLVMAFGPLATLGVGLLLYNFLRFESPWEFGMKYALSGSYIRDKAFLNVGQIGPNLKFYLFQPLLLSRYFPFFAERQSLGAGMLWMAPIVAGVVGTPLIFRGAGRWTDASRVKVLVLTVGLAALASLAMLALFIGYADRYLVDLLPIWILFGAIGWLLILEASHARPGWKVLWAVGCGTSALLTVAVNLAFGFARLPQRARLLPVARLCNQPAAWIERLSHADYGAYHLSVSFAERPGDTVEPLLVSGSAPDRFDAVYVHYLLPRKVTIGFIHAGAGTIESAPMSITPGEQLDLRVFFGALLPPLEHPIFSNWTERELVVARNSVWVDMNGKRILTGASESYPVAPSYRWIGEMPYVAWAFHQSFSGRIQERGRGKLVRSDFQEPETLPSRPVELTLRLPIGGAGRIEPLIETGTAQRGDLLWVKRTGSGRARFGVFLSGFGGPETDEVEFDPSKSHHLVVWMGSLLTAGAAPDSHALNFDPARRVTIVFDGRILLDVPQELHPAAPNGQVNVGRTVLGFGIGEAMFSGKIESLRALEWKALPDFSASGSYGAVKMTLRLPDPLAAVTEPLVSTGTTGAGDFLFIRYLGNQVQFGFDHWAVGEIIGTPVAIDPQAPMELELTMESLYSREQLVGSAPQWARRVEVRMNGKVVLSGVSACHPTSVQQIQIGKNLIGGSSCGPRFTGKILKVSRPPWPEFPP